MPEGPDRNSASGGPDGCEHAADCHCFAASPAGAFHRGKRSSAQGRAAFSKIQRCGGKVQLLAASQVDRVPARPRSHEQRAAEAAQARRPSQTRLSARAMRVAKPSAKAVGAPGWLSESRHPATPAIVRRGLPARQPVRRGTPAALREDLSSSAASELPTTMMRARLRRPSLAARARPQLREVLARMMRRPRQRAGRHQQEALGGGDRLVGRELLRRHEARPQRDACAWAAGTGRW